MNFFFFLVLVSSFYHHPYNYHIDNKDQINVEEKYFTNKKLPEKFDQGRVSFDHWWKHNLSIYIYIFFFSFLKGNIFPL